MAPELPIGGKEKKIALGSYPEISPKDARLKAEDARRQLLNGVDAGADIEPLFGVPRQALMTSL